MDSYVCAIAGGKGGVGRTTTAINLGTALEAHAYDVVVVDADLGMSNVAAMTGIEPEETIHDVLAGNATVEEALVELDSGLTLLPGEWAIEAYGDADAANLKEVVETLREMYDVVLVDTSAGINHEKTVSVGLADGTILVTTASDVSLADTRKTAQLAERVGGNVLGTILTCVTSSAQVSDARERLEHPLLGVVPEELSVSIEPLVVVDETSVAGEAYRALAEAVVTIVFDGVDPDGIDLVFEPEWVDEADEAEEDESDEEDDGTGDGDETGQDDDDEDDGGVLGLFN